MAASANTLIQVKNLKMYYLRGKIKALNDVSVDINKGDVMVVIGPSGSGKSTLLRSLNLMENPTAGEIIFNGVDITKRKYTDANGNVVKVNIDAHRQKMGMVFQHFNLFPHMTILDNMTLAPIKVKGMKKDEAEAKALALLDRVGLKDRANAYPIQLSGGQKQRVAIVRALAMELLEKVGLADRANAYPSQLSGGQKQRVAIARALATDPKVLLCDEATSALDPTTTASILALLKDLNQKLGVTVVVITHQMSVIEEICSRVAILDGGVVAEEGDVEEIFSNPKTDAARRLVYPGGTSMQQYPAGTHAVRVAFNGGTAYQPLIASLAIDCGVKVNILGADTRNIDGKAFGTMLLGLPEDPAEAAKAMSYLKAQRNVTVEEVKDYHE